MAGAAIEYERVPYFWSDFHEWHMILRGYPGVGERSQVLGDPATGSFVELCFDDHGLLRMGMALSKEESLLDPISDELERLIGEGAHVDRVDLAKLTLSSA